MTGDHASCGSCREERGESVSLTDSTMLRAGLVGGEERGCVTLTDDHASCGSCKQRVYDSDRRPCLYI